MQRKIAITIGLLFIVLCGAAWSPSMWNKLKTFVGDSGTGGAPGMVPAPAAGDGAAQKVLSADGTWINPPSSGAAGGDTQIQYNDSGDLAGDANLTFTAATDVVTIGGTGYLLAPAVKVGTNSAFTGESASGSGSIVMYEDTDNGTDSVTFAAPAALTADRTITIPDADVTLSDIALNTTHRTSDGSDHTFLDQDVTSGSSPTLDGTNFTGIPDGALDTDYVEVGGDTMTGALNMDGGNITMAGAETVDGRDVSVDGSKLDGIEALADVTDATNVAAAGAIMDADFTAADEIMVGTGAGTHTQITLGASEFLAKKAAGTVTNVSAADARTILNVEDGADVTDATNVGAAGAVMESDYNAHTILQATADNTPAALTVAEQTLVGRITAGNITALTATQVRTLINVEDGADVTDFTNVSAALGAATGAVSFNSQNITTVGTVDGVDVSAVSLSNMPTAASGNIDCNGQAITNVGNVDGVDVSAIVSCTTANVNAAGAVMESDYTAADVVLVGTGAGTTGTVTLGASEILGKAAAGNVTNLSAANVRTIINVEDGADVTDAANVISSLSGAVLTAATVATGDKVLIQDADAADALKTVTAQSIADLAAPEGTAIKSTGEAGGTKFLREDGDGTCSWQDVAAGGGGTVQGTDGTYDIQPTAEGATAGNARGEYSTDLQTYRSGAAQVASGQGAFIGAGYQNTASGNYSAVVSGQSNTAANTHSVACGGLLNYVSSNYSFIGGGENNEAKTNTHATVGGGYGNDATGQYSVVGGGYTNDATGQYSVVGGGYTNIASGIAAAICGGINSSATDSYSAVCGGNNNDIASQTSFIGGGSNSSIVSGANGTVIAGGNSNIISSATADYSSIGGGQLNEATAAYSSIAGGSYAKTYLAGQASHAYGKRSANGDAQFSRFIVRLATTNATPQTLGLNGAPATRLVMPASRTWVFNITVSAYQYSGTGTGDAAGYTFTGVISRDGANNTAIIGSVTKTVLAEDQAAWDCDVTADDTNEALQIQVTGEASKSISWVATVEVTEAG